MSTGCLISERTCEKLTRDISYSASVNRTKVPPILGHCFTFD